MIAKMLTQENLSAMLNKGAISSRAGPIDMPRITEIDTSKILETLGRISPTNPVEFLIRLGETESSGGISLHFEGGGWRLSGIQLPTAALRLLAQDLVNTKGRNG